MINFIDAIWEIFKKIFLNFKRNDNSSDYVDISIKIKSNNRKIPIVSVKPESDYCRIERHSNSCKKGDILESDYCRINRKENCYFSQFQLLNYGKMREEDNN